MKDYLRAFKAEFLLNLRQSLRYKMSFFSDLIVQFLIYSALLFAGRYTWMTREYGGAVSDSKSLMLVGYVFWSYAILAIGEIGSAIKAEANRGTLEQKCLSVVPLSWLLMAKAFSGVIVSTTFVAMLIGMSMIVFNVSVKITFGAFMAWFIMIIGMYGFGYMMGGIALIVKKLGQLTFLVQIALLFLTGTIMPLKEFPYVFRVIGESLPLTLGMEIARTSIGGTKTVSFESWILLVFISMIYLLIGLSVFHVSQRIARHEGLLGRY